MTIVEHTMTFFLTIREVENEYLSSNALKFIDHVGELLQEFIDRWEHVRLIKELYRNQRYNRNNELSVEEFYNISDVTSFLCKVIVSLRYIDLVSILPTAVSVLAWPKQSDSLTTTMVMSRRSTNKFIPERMSYAEDSLEIMSLPEHEPDVSWVNCFVKEVPSGNTEQLFSLEQKRNGAFNDIMPSWIDQLYIEQDI
ncbi:OLC1v1037311C1 [Oldenlandia corymbosa var. corymbosa]|uniref:OLC1v1037311C1 n=1 Tax=Oldenlandia corymbosa var. corymbosa TaxID=529605 RepID=A0AAV1CYA1_OLDCO|nr:OLC1v1037311C1 [Oldenlandia corymbosa var. corymbosa]